MISHKHFMSNAPRPPYVVKSTCISMYDSIDITSYRQLTNGLRNKLKDRQSDT